MARSRGGAFSGDGHDVSNENLFDTDNGVVNTTDDFPGGGAFSQDIEVTAQLTTGRRGPQGIQGVGISDVTIDSGGLLTITLTNGTATTYTIPAGPAGMNGTTGPAGPQGPQGNPGTDGMDGAAGPMGTPGNDGQDGQTGPQGPQGPQGVMGLQGTGITSVTYSPTNPQAGDDITVTVTLDSGVVTTFTIPAGTTGATGAQGPAGQDGQDGQRGPAGAPGNDGQDGAGVSSLRSTTDANGNSIITLELDDGSDLPDFTVSRGPQGLQGPTGPAGTPGQDGMDGAPGQDGMDGATGPQGPAGPTGPQGTSVDDISTAMDASGNTEVTLQLDDGTNLPAFTVNRGLRGLEGHGGPQGVGVDDLTSTTDSNGNTIVTLELDDGNVLPSFTINRGLQGPQGPAGQAGAGAEIVIQDEGTTLAGVNSDIINFIGDDVHAVANTTDNRYDIYIPTPAGAAKSASSLANYRAFRSTEHTNNITVTASAGTTFTNDSSNPITVTPTGATIGPITYSDDLITIPVVVAAGAIPGTNNVSVVIGDIDYDSTLGSGTFTDQTIRSSILDQRSNALPSLTTTPTSRSILSTVDQTYTVTRANDATVNSGTGWDVNDDYTITGITIDSGGSPFTSGATTDTFTVAASEYTSNVNITVNFDLASPARNGQTGDPGNNSSTVSIYTPYVLLASTSTPTSFPSTGHSTSSWSSGSTISFSGSGNAFVLIVDTITDATVNDGQSNINPVNRGTLDTTTADGSSITYNIWDYGAVPSVSYTIGSL